MDYCLSYPTVLMSETVAFADVKYRVVMYVARFAYQFESCLTEFSLKRN